MHDRHEPLGEPPHEPPSDGPLTRRQARANAAASGASGAPRAPRASGGVLASLRRHRGAWIVAGACAGFVVLGSSAVAVGASVAGPLSASAPSASATRSASPTPSATPTPRPTPSAVAAASRLRTCSVASLAADPRLGDMEAQVRNAQTGQVLFDRNGDKPNPTASVMKVVTAAAALKVLGPDFRIKTTVVAGPDADSVILVGGGDPTLSRLPSTEQPFYAGAPHIDDLARQTLANHPEPITTVYVDTSLFGKPYWQPTWNEHEERFVDGSSSYVTALQVDGDRANPRAMDSERGSDPVRRAADAFVAALGGGVSYQGEKKASADATQLAAVQSQPVSSLVKLAITYSDNTIMEMLTRLVAIKTGAGNTFSAENQGVLSALAGYGIPTTGIHIADGSGLSEDNRVPPSYLTQLFIKVLNGESGLGVVYDGLPVSGETGTLAANYGRFSGSSAIARGAVNAKTGSVDDGYSLAGIVHAKDGTPLTFAIYAFGNVNNSARTAIDALTTGFYSCGDNLSNR